MTFAPLKPRSLRARPSPLVDTTPSGLTLVSLFSFCSHERGDGQLHTLSVLEQLREASKGLWGASSEAYFRVDEFLRQLADRTCRTFPASSPFGGVGDESDQHIRWVIAARRASRLDMLRWMRRLRIIQIRG